MEAFDLTERLGHVRFVDTGVSEPDLQEPFDEEETKLTLSREGNSEMEDKHLVPIYGSYAEAVSKLLNKMYAKEESTGDVMDKVESLGRDFGDEQDPTYNYKLNRKVVVSGPKNQISIQDTHLAIENMNYGVEGIGLYDISHQLAGMAKGVMKPIYWTMNYDEMYPTHLETIKELIKKGHQVVLVLFVPKEVAIDSVKFNDIEMYDIMTDSNRLSVFLTYAM